MHIFITTRQGFASSIIVHVKIIEIQLRDYTPQRVDVYIQNSLTYSDKVFIAKVQQFEIHM